jgi:putative membrane protein
VTKDSTASATTATTAPADTGDVEFATTAAMGGMAEVQMAQLAIQKTTNPKIKDFANMMVTDHGKANDTLKAIAQKKNIALPTALDAKHQGKYDDLSKLSGSAFDKAYVSAMVDGHEKTLKLMQAAAQNCKDPDLKAFAAKVAPTVQMHLDAINRIQAGMK